MGPGADRRPEPPIDLAARPGSPLRGLRWGLLLAVAAALVLFAGVLVVEDGRSGDGTPAGLPTPPGSTGQLPGSTGQPAAGPTTAATSPPGPAAATGALVARGALAGGWETEGWSWDSTVTPGLAGPDGTPAVTVTYKEPYGGFALRHGMTARPAAGAVLRVRVYLTGSPVRLGLQVQSADDGKLGPVVQRDVPSRQWVTLTAPLSELRPPDGVRRVSVIAQNVTPGTQVWVSDVTLG